MKVILLAFTACLWLCGPSVSTAQVALSETHARQVAERANAVTIASRRASEIMTLTLGDPGIIGATSPESLALSIEALRAEIIGYRQELSEMHQAMMAFRPVAIDETNATLRSIDQSIANSAGLILHVDGVLQGLLAIPPAVQARDQKAYEAAALSLVSGAILLQEAQAVGMRAQAALAEADPVLKTQFLALACFSDGQAVMQAGLSGVEERSGAVREVQTAATCMRQNVEAGRTALDDYVTAGGARMQPVRTDLLPINAAIFDTLGDAAQFLADAGDALDRNEDPGLIATRALPRQQAIVSRLQDLDRQRQQVVQAARLQ